MEHEEPPSGDAERSPFTRRVAWTVGFVAVAVAVATVFVYAANMLLLVFAALLFGVLVSAPVDALADRGWPRGVAFTVVLVGGTALVGAVLFLVGDGLVRQATDLVQAVPLRLNEVVRTALESPTVRNLWAVMPELQDAIAQVGDLAGRAYGAASSLLEALGALLFVIVTGLFLAAEPALYRTGAIRLLAPPHRAPAEAILDELHRTLRYWMLGRAVAMLLVGATTGLGTWALGVPLPLALGVLSGTLDFIPNVGPFLAVVPALLLALSVGPETALLTALLYFVVQQLEGWLLTPLIERRAVRIPPALLLATQIVVGVAFGWLALAFATPLLAIGIILVRRLWIEPHERMALPAASPGDRIPP